jgi:beta-lactamase regulating signal transducer with metallopeptidase domain
MLTALIEAALRGSLLLAMTWLVLRALRVRDVTTEKRLWTLVAAASLAMPLLSRAVLPVASPFDVLPSRPAALQVLQDIQPAGTHIALWCSIGYLLGMVALMARFVTGLWMGARIRRRARRLSGQFTAGVDVRVSTALRGPASFGATILFPPGYESWDGSMLAAVLAHEQAHIRNRDAYRLWLATLYRAIFWFNPLAHLLYQRLQMLSELTSDEAAAAAIGDRTAYANVLRHLASPAPLFAATVAMAIRSTLEHRLDRLARESISGVRPSRRLRAVLVGTICVFVALAAGLSGRATVLAAERVAGLEFYLVDEHGDAYTAQSTGKVPAGDRLYMDRNGRPILLRRQAITSSGELTQVSTKQTDDGPVVQVSLSKRGAASVLRTTSRNIGARMAVVYTEGNFEHVISQAVIRGKFGGEFQISGLNAGEAATLASQFDHALPK